MKTNLVFYGANDSVRTAVCKAVGERLDMIFCDMDDLIVYESRRYTPEHAITAYKEMEAWVAEQVSEYVDVVVGASARIFETAANIELLARGGVLIYLNTGHGAPELRACADIVIDAANRSPEEIFGESLVALSRWEERIEREVF